MSLTGSELVSSSNLAASLGLSASGALTGNEPISSGNLAAVVSALKNISETYASYGIWILSQSNISLFEFQANGFSDGGRGVIVQNAGRYELLVNMYNVGTMTDYSPIQVVYTINNGSEIVVGNGTMPPGFKFSTFKTEVDIAQGGSLLKIMSKNNGVVPASNTMSVYIHRIG